MVKRCREDPKSKVIHHEAFPLYVAKPMAPGGSTYGHPIVNPTGDPTCSCDTAVPGFSASMGTCAATGESGSAVQSTCGGGGMVVGEGLAGGLMVTACYSYRLGGCQGSIVINQ